jgi:hypothetical protein
LTSKKPLIPHGTQACCINLQNWNFRTVWTNLLGPFSQSANLEFRLKAKCRRQEKCKLGYHKVLSCPPHFLIYI